jgi:hypothetical protein
VVTAQCLERVERELASEAPHARDQIDGAFARFESTQPHLAQAVSDVLSQSMDDTALALGYFLSIAIWLAFDHTFGQKRLREVSGDAIEATDAAIDLEEELRTAHGGQPLDLDDVVSVEQPGILEFVHRHVDSALSPTLRSAIRRHDRQPAPPTTAERREAGEIGPGSSSQGEARAAQAQETRSTDDANRGAGWATLSPYPDAEDIHSVYRVIVLLTLCLSHAVVPVEGAARSGQELLA